jgi:hypothetical protein
MTAAGIRALLILAIVGCPAFCGRAPVGRAQGTATTGCCHCCKPNSDRTGSQSAPLGPREQPSSPECQCVCGGAISVKAIQLDLTPHAVPFLPLVVLGVELRAADGARFSCEPFPDVGWVPSGREVCCLHMSFLC